MPRLSRVFAACLALFVSTSALAVELNYQWKKGDTHRFNYEDDTTFQMDMAGGMPGMTGMPGMGAGAGAGMRMKVQTTFTEKVLAVRPDGTADIELTVNKLDLFQGEKKVASINQIPPAARVVKAEVDRKGHAKFFQMVTVYMQDNQMLLGVHKAQVGPNGASSSTDVGDQHVDLVASVNPKTGKVTASMKVTERPPALKKVVIKEEDPGVDVLPKQIFEMMVLPEGSMNPGQRVDVAMPFGTMHVELAALEGSVAKLRTRLDGTRVEATAPAEQTAVEDENADDTNAGGMNMGGPPGGMNMGGPPGGMNMGGPPGGNGMPSGGAPSAAMKMDVDVTGGFDVAKGRLLTLAGTLASDMSMGGSSGMGGMKVNSRFTLKRVP